MEEPKFEMRYGELVEEMRKNLVQQGVMKPVAIARFSNEIDNRLETYKEVYGDFLRSEWPDLFPGVDFSEKLLAQELERALAQKKNEALTQFKEEMKKHEKYRVIRNWVFRSRDATLLFSVGVSFVTVPVFVTFLFTPSDLMSSIGGIGLLLNMATVGFFFFKSLLRKESR